MNHGLFRNIFLTALFLQLAACASPARQTEALVRGGLAGELDIPPRRVLHSVPHVDHAAGSCGPAALTAALSHAGLGIGVDRVAPLVLTSGKNGSLPVDMLSAARRLGMMAVQIETLSDLAAEVADGHTVIVLQNLGLSWAPRWHYANVVGYDLAKQEIFLHTGSRAFEAEPLRHFERSWGLADFWALVILPPGRLSARASELAHLRGAAGLEQAGKAAEAFSAYESILSRWPESLGALVGAANVAYSAQEYRKAVGYLKRASVAHPDSVVARHNLEVAERAARAF